MNKKSHVSPNQARHLSDCELMQVMREKAAKRNAPVERSKKWHLALPRARDVELLLLDVDGVLTDGTIFYDQTGGEIKGFNTQDGFGLNLLRRGGVDVGLITAKISPALVRRCHHLNITRVYQGAKNKLRVFDKILLETRLRPPQVAYMGDDWLDLQLLARVGLSAAPPNAVPEVLKRVHYITDRRGGQGAVREVCDLILEARGVLASLFQDYA